MEREEEFAIESKGYTKIILGLGYILVKECPTNYN